MDIKKFILSYYKNATDNFYISRLRNPTEALKLHTHDYYQLYYVLKGGIRHHVEGKSAVLFHGDVFIIPPNMQHFISKEDADSEFYSLSFTANFFEKTIQSNLMLKDFLDYLTNTPAKEIHPKLFLKATDSFFIETLLDRIMKEFTDKNIGSEAIIRECTSLLITLFSQNYFRQKVDTLSYTFQTNEQFVLHCMNYISENFSEDITLDEISRNATMSKSCFCRLFSTISGMSFKQFLNTKRIEKAIELISLGNYKMSTIGLLCGYSDFSTFFRNFKKITGISPVRFKKMNKFS